MRKGRPMEPVDATGLPNHPTGRAPSKRLCPVCGAAPPVHAGGVAWKWLAVHLAEHLGWRWTSRGWESAETNRAAD